MLRVFNPQALSSGLYSRLTKEGSENGLLINTTPVVRTARRHAQVNYAELDYNDDIDEEFVPEGSIDFGGLSGNMFGNNSARYNGNGMPVNATQKYSLRPARGTPRIPQLEMETKIQELAHRGNAPDILIPIRLNLEYNNGNSKLVDFFMWNLNETLITPEQFASILCTDLELPANLHLEITDTISKQIEEYNYASSLQLPSTMEYHIIIDLSVNLNKKLYQDRFEWDLAQTEITPDTFADIVVGDLGLSLEFKPAILHSLHEVLLRLKREICEGSYNHELQKYQQLAGLIFECGIRIRTENSIHNGNDLWQPIVEILTAEEIEKREIERERNIRRLKRENMRLENDEASNKRRATARRRYDELEGSWKY
ncbi:Chromatin structure remodeling complex protein sfh1 [Scheffersomyces spartinae]|uniref:Chromatin structure remodeling complex protein sfh1 n=1 Tax=Scheffersomyces spartinae TaxID=45513 RepID=A0A9P7V9T6_9ASCO|nr:Chromatin structure remodeling complex protein sfh1 [Scheffersomyces spartinae]KAG7193840.1 Chromatin structure remodeling complex protein sfh1 [Scheffersomyces spartinae]